MNTFLKKMPDFRVKINTKESLEPKCKVLYFPIDLGQEYIDSVILESILSQSVDALSTDKYLNRPISILWSHRWEHDKNPEEFFNSLFKLDDMGIDFRLHVIGEQFTEIPGNFQEEFLKNTSFFFLLRKLFSNIEIFYVAKERLKSKIVTWGFLPSRSDYYKVLSQCDLIISTSLHEFFGVAV
jgi:glycosyltransferase involved in cell wall biosynthesis